MQLAQVLHDLLAINAAIFEKFLVLKSIFCD